MSEEKALAEAGSTDLAALDAKLAAKADKLKSSITLAGNFITVQKNGRFKMPSGDERDSIDGVILDYRYKKNFYPKPYRKGEFSEAVCYATGEDLNSMVPSEAAAEPQAVGGAPTAP